MQLHEESEGVTQFSIQTLYYMLREPAAAADIIKADLAGLVVQIIQGPSLKSVAGFSTIVLNSLHGFSCQPEARQQLLDRLTPDSARVMIELSLDALEDPNACHTALVFAAGGALLLLCSFSPSLHYDLLCSWQGPSLFCKPHRSVIHSAAAQAWAMPLSVCRACKRLEEASESSLVFTLLESSSAHTLSSCIQLSCLQPAVFSPTHLQPSYVCNTGVCCSVILGCDHGKRAADCEPVDQQSS